MGNHPEIIITLVIFGLIGLLAFFILKKLAKLNKQKIKLFDELAKKHNLSHTYDKNKKLNVLHQLKGKYKGYPIHIFEQMEGQRKGQHLATHIVFLDSPFNFEFTISKENLINKVEKKLNKQDVLFNDNALDNTFWLKSNDEIKFKRLLNTRKIEALKSIENNLYFKIENKGNELSYTIYENLYSPKAFKDLEFVMDFMVLLLK